MPAEETNSSVQETSALILFNSLPEPRTTQELSSGRIELTRLGQAVGNSSFSIRAESSVSFSQYLLSQSAAL